MHFYGFKDSNNEMYAYLNIKDCILWFIYDFFHKLTGKKNINFYLYYSKKISKFVTQMIKWYMYVLFLIPASSCL